MLVAYVLVREAYDFGTEHRRDLRVPAVKENSKENLEDVKYDCVSAISKDVSVVICTVCAPLCHIM